MSNTKLISLLSITAVIVTPDEALRVDYVDLQDNVVRCTGEESGDNYTLAFADIDLDNWSFYELKAINVASFEE